MVLVLNVPSELTQPLTQQPHAQLALLVPLLPPLAKLLVLTVQLTVPKRVLDVLPALTILPLHAQIVMPVTS